MVIRIPEYNGGYSIVSIVKSKSALEDLSNENLDFWYVTKDAITVFPNQTAIQTSASVHQALLTFDDYDAVEVYEDGTVYPLYSNCAEDNLFFITGKCNSNCVMCPSPEFSRKNGGQRSIDSLIELAKHIPITAKHFTITGGEPFLVGKSIFVFLKYLQSKFDNTDFLILTNGRIFALDEYGNLLADSIPNYTMLGVPLHASYAQLHDKITRVTGSFEQTVAGIENLLARGITVEIRIVVSMLNRSNLPELAAFISEHFTTVNHVSIMGMEMTGTAHENRDDLWVPYSEIFPSLRKATDIMLKAGIDVMLFNFPLCSVDPGYWSLCRRSISPEKIRYSEKCSTCRVKKDCGGVFVGTMYLEEDELKPIK